MAIEDFTTYTEVDEDGDITIIASKVSWVNIQRGDDSYVYKDYGAGFFGDFEHDFEMQINTSDDNAICGNWVLSNEIANFEHTLVNHLPGLCVRTSKAGGVYSAVIYNLDNGVVDVGVISANTLYYCTATRVGTTFTLYIYSDSARSVLVDTLTVTCTNTTLRYIYGMSTKLDSPGHVPKHNGFTQNLDFNLVVATGASIYYWDGSNNVELQLDNTSPVQMYNGVEIIGLKLGETDDPNASPFHVFDGVAIKAILKMP